MKHYFILLSFVGKANILSIYLSIIIYYLYTAHNYNSSNSSRQVAKDMTDRRGLYDSALLISWWKIGIELVVDSDQLWLWPHQIVTPNMF